jgi:hypothetical protein
LSGTKREIIAAYRAARSRARRSTTPRLRHDESRAHAVLASTFDDVEFARLTAVRDELQARGAGVLPLGDLSAVMVEARR